MSFIKISEKYEPIFNVKIEVFEHTQTKLIHYHLNTENTESSFNIVFNTIPQNSTGTQHILEHIVLNGSKKYPNNNIFFKLIGKNLETFMNAMTGANQTQYLFSSIDKKGYFNLMNVYLDSVFNPLITKDRFLNEAWHYEIENNELKYNGIVFNEMKGALADSMHSMYPIMKNNIYKNNINRAYSGGIPEEIIKLKYDELLDYYKNFYHPTNAIIYTSSKLPATDLHTVFEEYLKSYSLNKKHYLEDYVQDKHVFSTNYSEGVHFGESGAFYVKNYAIPKYYINDKNIIQNRQLLKTLFEIFDNGQYNFELPFVNSKYDISLDSYELNFSEPHVISFIFNIQNFSDNENLNDIKDEINYIFNEHINRIISNSLNSHEINNYFETFELVLKKQSLSFKDSAKYFIHNLIELNENKLKHAEVVSSIDFAQFDKLKELLKNKDIISKMFTDIFVQNKDVCNYISISNNSLLNEQEITMKENLSLLMSSLSNGEREKIIKETKHLNEFNSNIEEEPLLPKVSLQDIHIDLQKHPILHKVNNDIYNLNLKNNEVNEFYAYYPININNMEEFLLNRFLIVLLNKMPLKNKTVEETEIYKKQNNLDFNFELERIFKNNAFYFYLKVHSSYLNKNADIVLNKLNDFQKNVNFLDKDLLIKNLESFYNDYVQSKIMNAYHINHLFSKQFISAEANQYLQMFTKTIEFCSNTIKQKNNEDYIDKFTTQLEQKYTKLFSIDPIVFCNGFHSNEYDYFCVNNLEEHKGFSFDLNNSDTDLNLIEYDFSTNFVHSTFIIPPKNTQEYIQFQVLCKYFSYFLNSEIREKNGAYGSSMSLSGNKEKGYLTLSSFRDPSNIKTMDLFKNIGNVLLKQDLSNEKLEEAKISYLKKILVPKSQYDLIGKSIFYYLNETENTDEFKIDVAQKTTIEDLINIINKYLVNKESYSAISCNPKNILSEHLDSYKYSWNKV